MELIAGIVAHLKAECPNITKIAYVEALSALFFVPEFRPKIFIDRALANPRAFVACASRPQALEVIEEVYNFRSRIPVNLAFLATEMMKKRSVGKPSLKEAA